MPSQITIGRFGSEFDVSEIDTWDLSQDRIRVAGELFGLTVAEAKAARQQIAGLAESDEPVPVTWLDDSSQDGYYRVVSTSVDTTELTLTNGHLVWSATLERPVGFSSLRPSLLLSGTSRVGKPVAITAKHRVVVTEGFGVGAYSGVPTETSVFLFGDVPLLVMDLAAFAPRNSIRMIGPSSLHYIGAATTKMGGFTVIGRQYAQTVEDWSITNGFVTVTPGTSASAIFSIKVQNPAGSAKPAPTLTYEIEFGRFAAATWTASTVHTVTSVQVLHETVELQVVRLSGTINLGGTGANSFTCDLSLRRGALGVDVIFQFSKADKYGIGWVSTIASTTISAANTGFYKTAADADGMSPFIVHPPSGFLGGFTRDLAAGRCYFTGFDYATAPFFVGLSEQSGAVTDAADMQDLYFSTVREVQRMVGA